jgi:hypothetical protein
MAFSGIFTRRPIMSDDIFNPDDVIFAYTRAQALTDGVLVDVSATAREAGFTIPVALTLAVFEDCVRWTDADRQRRGAQDEAGRLWDVLFMASLAIRRVGNGNRASLGFELVQIPRFGPPQTEPIPVHLKMAIGPGDAGEPVLTILLPQED